MNSGLSPHNNRDTRTSVRWRSEREGIWPKVARTRDCSAEFKNAPGEAFVVKRLSINLTVSQRVASEESEPAKKREF